MTIMKLSATTPNAVSTDRLSTTRQSSAVFTTLAAMDRDRLLTAVTLVALFLAGLVVGCWSIFLVPLRLPGGVEGLADVLVVVAGAGLGVLGTWGTRTLVAAVLPGLGILTVVALATIAGPGGDVLLAAGVTGDPGLGVVGELVLLAALAGPLLALVLATRLLRRTPAPPPSEG
jgi:hypothetical protein